ncbi:MAG: TonB-dependent receptor [Barnesiella sp.]|nr:TonB-dependent receptor [Bacteroidales bacterium]MBD5250447.1 TonB-dependent receptor [Barnesiella sp.]
MKKLFLLLTAVFCFAVMAQARTISGTVIDAENEEPLPGATVVPNGGGTGVATDFDGNFTMEIPDNVKTVTVSYVGYAPQTAQVAENMVIKMVADNQLETVVVVGYGQSKKLGSVVGSVSVVGEQVFKDVPTATFLDALQGQVPGLNIASNSGDPSANEMHIRMRGVNSLNAGNTPLFILDGAPITSAVFTTLNPSDIESVTVLKDASSVAIYGSRAANGVIVITSKKGKFQEKAKVNIRASYGWSQMAHDNVTMMNSEQYIRYRDLIGKPVSEEIRSLVDNYGISTNWRDEVFSNSAPTYQLDASVRGGSENSSYYVSLNHYDADGIMPQSHLRRSTLRANITTRVTDWFRFGFKTNLGYEKGETNSQNNTAYSGGDGKAYMANPSMFARVAFPYDSPRYYTFAPDGQIVYGEKAKYLRYSDLVLPQALANTQSVAQKNLSINASIDETIVPIEGLTLRAQQNVDAFDYRYSGYQYPRNPEITPMGDVNDWYGSPTGSNSQSFQRYYSFTYTNTAEYTRTFSDVHNLTVLLGQEAILTKSESFGASGAGYTDSRLMFLTNAVSPLTVDDLSQRLTKSVFNSFFGTASYDYNNRYFVDATYRRDGSSKFAAGHRWANFWSLGGMWRITNEDFMKSVTWLNDLSLRLSYGTTGNSSISDWLYAGQLGGGNIYSGGLVGNDGQSIGIASPSNVDLTWETVRSWDLGLGFAVLNNKIKGEIDFYRKETVDMLMSIPYSYTTGFSGGYGNIGNMTNTGVDIDLNFAIFTTKDWYWGIRANFNYNRNEITKLFNGQDTFTVANTGTQYKVGHSAGEMYTVEYAGVDPRDGQQMWIDKDGNLTKQFNEERDAKLIGKSMYAPYSGGFGTDVRWRDFSLRVDFNWAAKKYMINNDRYFVENNNFADQSNQNVKMLEVWTYPGQITDVPAADGQTLQFDSHLIENASYLRLKNLTLTYKLPQSALNKLHLDNVAFHFTGRNLLTFTDYSGYDPEPETNLVAFFYPNTRQYEIGFEVAF